MIFIQGIIKNFKFFMKIVIYLFRTFVRFNMLNTGSKECRKNRYLVGSEVIIKSILFEIPKKLLLLRVNKEINE